MIHEHSLKTLLCENDYWEKRKSPYTDEEAASIFVHELKEEGYSKDFLDPKEFLMPKVFNFKLIEDLRSGPLFIKKCISNEGAAKVILTATLFFIGPLFEVLSNKLKLAKTTVENTATARDTADTVSVLMPKTQDFLHYFGFDDNLIDYMPGNFVRSLTDVNYKQEMKDGSIVHSILYKLKNNFESDKIWTMKSFQQFCVHHYYPDKRTRSQLAQEIPEHDFVNWTLMLEKAQKWRTSIPAGFRRWLIEPLFDNNMNRKTEKNVFKSEEQERKKKEKVSKYPDALLDVLTWDSEQDLHRGLKN